MPIVINEERLMEGIDPIQSQEISILTEGVALNKLNQNKKACPKKQIRSPDVVVLSRIVQAMNNYLKRIGRIDVEIKVYKINDEIIIRAVSREQGTIIKNIRPEKLLNLKTGIKAMVGFLVSAMA